jgi:hypothetical protein
MAQEHRNIELLIKIANNYARENKNNSLVKLVIGTCSMLKQPSEKLEPEVKKFIIRYQGK